MLRCAASPMIEAPFHAWNSLPMLLCSCFIRKKDMEAQRECAFCFDFFFYDRWMRFIVRKSCCLFQSNACLPFRHPCINMLHNTRKCDDFPFSLRLEYLRRYMRNWASVVRFPSCLLPCALSQSEFFTISESSGSLITLVSSENRN